MKLLLSRLLLVCLCSLLSRASSGTLVVNQTHDVSVKEGESAHIACCWTETFERMTINWLKHQTEIRSESISSKTKCQNSVQKEQCMCSTLTFTRITREDSGKYFCKVSAEIPVYASATGSGTVITVIARANTGDHTDAARGRGAVTPVQAIENPNDNTAGEAPQEEVLIHVLRCLPILALIMTFFCLSYLGSKALQHTPAAPGNKPTSAQRTEEDQEDEERDEREKQQECDKGDGETMDCRVITLSPSSGLD